MAGQDETDLWCDPQFVEDGQVLRAGNAEDMVYAFTHQAVDQGACAGDGFGWFGCGGAHVASPVSVQRADKRWMVRMLNSMGGARPVGSTPCHAIDV